MFFYSPCCLGDKSVTMLVGSRLQGCETLSSHGWRSPLVDIFESR